MSAHGLALVATSMSMTATTIVHTDLLIHLSRNWLAVRTHAELDLRLPGVL
jgi:hypothetical protein